MGTYTARAATFKARYRLKLNAIKERLFDDELERLRQGDEVVVLWAMGECVLENMGVLVWSL